MSIKIPILYGTETGNAEYCAQMLAKAVSSKEFKGKSIDMARFKPADLHKHPFICIVTSTYGNGDAPSNAEELLRHLQLEQPQLNHLLFGVCALGSRSFTHFAKCGKDFEEALLKCGATRVVDRVDCDDDFDLEFEEFQEAVVEYLQTNGKSIMEGGGAEKTQSPLPELVDATVEADEERASYGSRENPALAPVLVKRLLSSEGSNKETMHYEFDLSSTDLSYQVGDTFGIYPENGDQAISRILEATGIEGEERFIGENGVQSVREVLKTRCLHHVGLGLIKELAKLENNEGSISQALAAGDAVLGPFMKQRDVLDVISESNAQGISAKEFLPNLRELQPRLYSVASSPIRDAKRVAFTVETLRYVKHGRSMEGVATCWLADQIQEGNSVPIYLVPNEAFHFPKDDRGVIMVGPGTGIAPFRAHLDDLEASGLKKKTWLFFGHQHQSKDFLYREELEGWQANGTLSRVDYAWSRDQEHKIYVQDRIRERGLELWKWLEGGASIYICGDAEGMAPAVAQAFQDVAKLHGKIHDPARWLEELVEQGRYKTDVY